MIKKTYQPSTEKSSPPVKTKVLSLIAAIGTVAALIANGRAIYEFAGSLFFPDAKVRIGWITASDSSSLDRCLLAPSKPLKLSASEKPVSLASNPCLTDLRQISDQERLSAGSGLQTLGASYFLVVENESETIDELYVHMSNGSTSGPHRSLSKGEPLAICIGFDRRSGHIPRTENPSEVKIVRGTKEAIRSVPLREAGVPRSVNGCGEGISWNYPP